MNRTLVKSSYIDSIGYEDDTLEVALKDGKVYRYIGVPADVHECVMGSESIGKAFQEHILKGGFTVEKDELEEEKVEVK